MPICFNPRIEVTSRNLLTSRIVLASARFTSVMYDTEIYYPTSIFVAYKLSGYEHLYLLNTPVLSLPSTVFSLISIISKTRLHLKNFSCCILCGCSSAPKYKPSIFLGPSIYDVSLALASELPPNRWYVSRLQTVVLSVL